MKYQEDMQKLCKKIDFNEDKVFKNEENIIFIESNNIIPNIMKIHQNSKKFKYDIQTINTDFNDFINSFNYFNNDENQNIENISNNSPISEMSTINKEKLFSKNNINNNKYIILSNGQKHSDKNSLLCNCKNSSCLKFYCECFSHGRCCQNCYCINCKNTLDNELIRQEKYKDIISRNPKAAYQINSYKKSFICNCKNSNCSKNYCDCFLHGKKCTSKCKCINCYNKLMNKNNDNNSGKKGKIRRIRGIKNNKYNIYSTPKRKNMNKDNYKNQSTAALTDINRNNKDKIVFNMDENKDKFKQVRERLNMEMPTV